MARPFRLPPEKRAEIVSLYSQGETPRTLSQTFGVSYYTVLGWVHRQGEKVRPRGCQKGKPHPCHKPTKYRCNETFFAEMSESRAYWLGMLAADGNVTIRTTPCITLRLKGSDAPHIARFVKEIEGTHPVHVKTRPSPFRDAETSTATVTVVSQRMADDLSKYGIVPQKSSTLPWPDLPHPMYRHYLRGLSDGDGSFRVARLKSGTPTLNWTLAGTFAVLAGVESYLEQTLGLWPPRIIQRGTHWGALNDYCAERAHAIAEHLYRDATIWLPRKRDVVAQCFPDLHAELVT